MESKQSKKLILVGGTPSNDHDFNSSSIRGDPLRLLHRARRNHPWHLRQDEKGKGIQPVPQEAADVELRCTPLHNEGF